VRWVSAGRRLTPLAHLVDELDSLKAWCGFRTASVWLTFVNLDHKCPKCLAKEAKVAAGILTTGLKAESHPSTSSTFELESWTETIDPRPSTSDKDKIPF